MLLCWFGVFPYCYVTFSDLRHVVPTSSCRWQFQCWRINKCTSLLFPFLVYTYKGFRFPAEARDSFLSYHICTGPAAHTASSPLSRGAPLGGGGGQSKRSVTLTSDLHIVPRLRINGTLPSLTHVSISGHQRQLSLPL